MDRKVQVHSKMSQATNSTDKKESVILCIDPSTVATGIAVLTKDGLDVSSCKVQRDNSPEAVLDTLKEIKEKYKYCDVYVAIEEWSMDVVSGLYQIKATRMLERAGERWCCIATLLKFKVKRILNQTWHSHFKFKRVRSGDAKTSKFQSVDLVLALYPELASHKLLVSGDLADSILIGKYLDDIDGILT